MRQLLAALVFITSSHAIADVTLESGANRVHLLELFTSQGCSSCPPAEAWLSNWSDDKRLWSEVVPMAWHVNYWDYIGWEDPFANSDWTQRQRSYEQSRAIPHLYTPNFVVDGTDWRGYFKRQTLELETVEIQTQLSASIDSFGMIKADVTSLNYEQEQLNIFVAIMGVGSSTKVIRGENRDRTLGNDFVVLKLTNLSFSDKRWQGKLDLTIDPEFERMAVALWAEDETGHIIQAAGSWLDNDGGE